jgi:hypothetical protein
LVPPLSGRTYLRCGGFTGDSKLELVSPPLRGQKRLDKIRLAQLKRAVEFYDRKAMDLLGKWAGV